MLATLARGITGGKWYSLIDKLYPATTLRAAFADVAANRGAAGVDHVDIEHYAANLDANLARLSEALRTGTYRPQAIQRHYIPKPGSQQMRPLGIPTVQDRITRMRAFARRANRAAHGFGTDFRTGFRGPQLRLSPQPGM
jgi:RNA-directed DNA polymerase